MDRLLGNNRHCSKLLNDSLTLTTRREKDGATESVYVRSYVFWLPFSWIQCCGIFFEIKEFLQCWIICWDNQWYKNQFENNTHEITNIDINQVDRMIKKIESMIKNTTTKCEQSNIFQRILEQLTKTLKVLLPRLETLNKFIDFFTSIQMQGMLFRVCVLIQQKQRYIMKIHKIHRCGNKRWIQSKNHIAH